MDREGVCFHCVIHPESKAGEAQVLQAWMGNAQLLLYGQQREGRNELKLGEHFQGAAQWCGN